jgi:hypothetical protein
MRRVRNRSWSRHVVPDLGRIPNKRVRFYVFEDSHGHMLSPSFFYGGVTAPVDENGRMHGAKFASGQDLPVAGTVMRSCFRRVLDTDVNLSCGAVIVAEEEAFEREEQTRRDEAHAACAIERARKEKERNEQAKAFNAALGIPVPFRPAQKIVLNGCYEYNISGARRNSVEHVLLKAAIRIGRIKRAEGQLLCGASRGSFGLSADCDNEDHIYAITCKRCLEIAAKFRNDAA